MQLLRTDEGSSLIEMAFILPVVLLLVFSLVDYALWIQKEIQYQDAASTAAAYGALPGNATDSSTMTQLATYNATGQYTAPSGFNVNATNFYSCTPGGTHVTATTACPTGAPYHYVQVTTSSSAANLIAFPGIPSSLTLSGAATYRVEVTP
jgi:Flp pilus assembly protein TadG